MLTTCEKKTTLRVLYTVQSCKIFVSVNKYSLFVIVKVAKALHYILYKLMLSRIKGLECLKEVLSDIPMEESKPYLKS